MRPSRTHLQVKAIARLRCPDFGTDYTACAHAMKVAGMNFGELSELVFEPFVYCFRYVNRWRVDDTRSQS